MQYVAYKRGWIFSTAFFFFPVLFLVEKQGYLQQEMVADIFQVKIPVESSLKIGKV